MICSAHRLIRRCGNENEPVASGVLSVSSFSSFNIWRLLIIKVTFLITKFKRAIVGMLTCNGNSFHIICFFNLKTNYSWIWSGSLVLPAVDHHPNGNDGSETKAEPDEHVLVELRLLQTWRKGFCHVDPIHHNFHHRVTHTPSRQSDRPSHNCGRGCKQVFCNKLSIISHFAVKKF